MGVVCCKESPARPESYHQRLPSTSRGLKAGSERQLAATLPASASTVSATRQGSSSAGRACSMQYSRQLLDKGKPKGGGVAAAFKRNTHIVEAYGSYSLAPALSCTGCMITLVRFLGCVSLFYAAKLALCPLSTPAKVLLFTYKSSL